MVRQKLVALAVAQVGEASLLAVLVSVPLALVVEETAPVIVHAWKS